MRRIGSSRKRTMPPLSRSGRMIGPISVRKSTSSRKYRTTSSVTVDVLCASAKPVAIPRMNRIALDGISSTSAAIRPSFSVATENRSSVSRAPVRSSELISTRNRIQTNARKIRVIASQPVEIRRRPFAADQIDEQLFERAGAVLAGADPFDGALRDDPAVGDHADVGRQPLDDLEDVRREEHGTAARHEGVQQILDLP